MRTRTSRRQLLGGLRAVAAQDLRNGVGEFEAPAVGPVAQRFDLANARQALLQQARLPATNSVSFGGNHAIIRLPLRRSISIIIPAYNEEKRLPGTWKRCAVPGAARVGVRRDRGGERRLARRHGGGGARGRARACCENPGNRGKGYSVRHGMLEAKGEWLLFTDADLSAPIEELESCGTRRSARRRKWPSARAPSTAR